MDQPEQIFALMMVCQSEGIHPVQALKRYHIIEGRPSMRADAMQAEFQRQGGTLEWVESSNEVCEAIFCHASNPRPFKIRVTLKDYVDSGVAMGWDKAAGKQIIKKNWRQFPAAMLRARVISSGVRAVLPGVVAGIYTPEEVQDFEKPEKPAVEAPKAPPITAPSKAAGPTKTPPVKAAAPVVEAEFVPVAKSHDPAGQNSQESQPNASGHQETQETAPPEDQGELAQREQMAHQEIDPERAEAIKALPDKAASIMKDQLVQSKLIYRLIPKEEEEALRADLKAAPSDSGRTVILQRSLDALRAELGGF